MTLQDQYKFNKYNYYIWKTKFSERLIIIEDIYINKNKIEVVKIQLGLKIVRELQRYIKFINYY